MPFYTYRAEDGEEVEKMFQMNERPDEIEIDGKLYTRVQEFSGNFVLKGVGWATKGNGTSPSPKHGKEVGIAVDQEKKRQMKNEGEI